MPTINPNTNANFSSFLTPAAGAFVPAPLMPARGRTFLRTGDQGAVGSFIPAVNPSLAGATAPLALNVPAGAFVPGVNPTGAGAFFTGVGTAPNFSVSAPPQTGNGAVINGVANQPLSQFSAGVAARIQWTPVSNTITPRLIASAPAAQASLLDSTGAVVPGTQPPYVDQMTVMPVGFNIKGSGVV